MERRNWVQTTGVSLDQGLGPCFLTLPVIACFVPVFLILSPHPAFIRKALCGSVLAVPYALSYESGAIKTSQHDAIRAGGWFRAVFYSPILLFSFEGSRVYSLFI